MKVNRKNILKQTLKKFKVKSEKLATRCDICHQADQFDPKSNTCLRCSNIPVAENNVPTQENNVSAQENRAIISPSVINLWSLITVKLHLISIFFLTIPLIENRKNIILVAPVQSLVGILVAIQSRKNSSTHGIVLGLSAIVFNILLYLFIKETKITRSEARQLLPFIEFGYLCFCMFIIFKRRARP